VARTFKEFLEGVASGPYKHDGAENFLRALPVAIEWVVVDTLSSLLTTQHAIHLSDQEIVHIKRVAEAVARKRPEPGLDKFAVYDYDLQRARRVQQIVEGANRHVLWLSHTAPWGDENLDGRSSTAGRPVVQGQFRTYLEAWMTAILYLEYGNRVERDATTGKPTRLPDPKLNVDSPKQIPLVKHKWDAVRGIVAPDLGALLVAVGEWPR
jgi:hypothetical protein